MTPPLSDALDVSRRTLPDAAGLSRILPAEESIACMDDASWEIVQRQLAALPGDAYLWLWAGLVLEHRGRFDAACNHYAEAIERGCAHWRVGWYIARSAKRLGNLALVDSACAAVLKANPEFWFARELPKHARGYYSQLGQDQIIEDFFAHQPARNKVFVEVGAFDGVHYSNVRRLVEQHGWSGVSIEPVGRNFEKLSQSYAGQPVRCIRAAASNTPGEVALHVSTYPHLPQWGSDVASISGTDNARWEKRYQASWTRESVPARTLTSMLEEAEISTIDFLTIDAEGHDLEVLQSLDLNRFQPQLIVVEYGSRRDLILSLLAQHGYSVLLDNKQDLFAARIQHALPQFPNLPTTRNFAGTHDDPAYQAIQRSVETSLPDWIGRPHDTVNRIVIVGGYLGTEVRTMLERYPKAKILIFEPSSRYFQKLQATYANEPRVCCLPYAVGDQAGSAVFHEGSMNGVGSLLPLKTRADQQTWIPKGLTPAESYTVKVVSLDSLPELANQPIDLLWCDVQGAELLVLRGAVNTLRHCRSLFLEVACSQTTYEGQCRLTDLREFCASQGFFLAGIGLCPSGNGTGNSVWLPLPAQAPSQPLPQRPWTELVNPHLLQIRYLPLESEPRRESVEPLRLLGPERFDLGAKLLYARHRALGIHDVWAETVYSEHIQAFSGGSCREADGLKTGIADYRTAFDQVLDSIGNDGFDANVSLVPVDRHRTPIDGSHRAAAALHHGANVDLLVFDLQANRYDWAFFQKRGLSSAAQDAIALEFVRWRTDAQLVFLFPCAAGRDAEVREILNEFGAIAYEKSIQLQREGPTLLVHDIYATEPWIGTWANGFSGAAKAARARFQGTGPLRVFLFVPRDSASSRPAKERIRKLFGLGNESCHINDTHAESVRLASLVFHAQSLHFLNHANRRLFERFQKHFDRYRDWIRQSQKDPERLCVDGSATMAAYGIRDAQDLDVLHHGDVDFAAVMPEVNSHNAHVHHHAVSRDEILFHPDHHFYFQGLKFVALSTLRAMKAKRAEGKDLKDVAAIDQLLGAGTSPATPAVTTPSTSVQTSAPTAPTPRPGQPRIIGLVPARNEAGRLPFCLRTLARFTDAIIYLDDFSDDDSVRVVEGIAAECRVERILTKKAWNRDEPGDRNALLEAGRQLGGTHFIVLDADEAFTANCQTEGVLRRDILGLLPGDRLVLTWIQLWRGLGQYRFDQSVWTNNRKAFAFADDGSCSYSSEFIHTPRVPANLKGRAVTVPGYDRGVLHFQFVHWPNLQIKQSWYRCMERVRFPDRPGSEINKRYAPSEDETALQTRPVPPEWFQGHPPLDPASLERTDERRVREVLHWFDTLGRHTFADLDVWRVDWETLRQSLKASPPAKQPGTRPATPPPPAKKPRRASNAVHDCLRQADKYFQEGKLVEAHSWLERVLDLDPDAADVWVASGNLLLQLGDFTNGIQSIQRAADLRPDHAPTLAALAAAFVQAGRIEDFEKALGTAFSINPSEPSAVRLLADLNFRSGQFQDAAHGYHQLIQLNGNDIHALLALGVCFAKTGDTETARAAFNEVLRVDPHHAIALENLSALGTTAASPTPPATAAAPAPVPTSGPAAAPAKPATPPAPSSATAADKPPLISAIISTYKSERYLRGCLQDLLQQTIADRLEIIVIDSGSPENERAIVEEFQARHPRIVYLRTERESIYGAWNRAVRLATAPYLTSANADDRHRPEALERLVAALEAHPDCALAYADCAVCENVHPDFGFTELRGYYRWPNFDRVLLFRGCYVGPQPVWRRNLHDRFGLFDPSYRSAGDYEFWLRLAKTEKFLHLPEVLGLHWYAEESLGHQNRELTRQESDHARILHWPSEWGVRPTQSFKTLHHIPAVEKQRLRNKELATRVETLEREKARLASDLKRFATESLTRPGPTAETQPPVAAIPAASTSPDSLTVPATSLLPTDTNPEAFQHLLRGFDLIRESRFEEAQAEAGKYREKVVYDALRRVDHRTGNAPSLTVVVVAHQTRQALLRCLDSLAHPSNPDHEVIVVDNGGNESIEAELQSRPLLHVQTPVNVLPSEARNIGVHFARASTVVFVDDDATVAPGYLASILAGFDAFDMVAFRGKVLPQTDHEHNDRVRHYDLGDAPITANLNTEGNCAIRVAVWKQLGGQDPLLFGGEGVELSFRITARFGPSAILYWPSAVIYHDYAEDDSKLDRKSDRHRAARAYLGWKHTGILEHHEFLKLPPRTDDERLQRTLPLRPKQAAVQVEPRPPETKPQAPVKSVVVDSPIAALRSALSFRGWMAKFDAYAAKLKSLEYIPSRHDPEISIVIIAHEIRVDSIRVLQKLQEDRDGRFEIVYVLNGSRTVEADQVRPFVDTLVELTENTGAYFARNVGAAFAKAGILFFLDDDAIPERGCVAAHLDEFRLFDVIAVRGAILPKTQNPLNELAKHYHLGDRRFPIHADVEGNTSYLAKPFFAVGGWDDEIVFGGGGIDLAFRLLQVESDRRRQIYSPVPVVYHDYAANEEHLARKHKKQAESRERLHRKHPRYEALRTAWQSFYGKDHLVLPKIPTDIHPTAAAAPSGLKPAPAPTAAEKDFAPLITVAIPTFNRARFLQEAVQSALHQTYPHLEVVIVDDGSTDETDSLLRTFCDPRVRCFTKEHSGGPATRNRCVQEARGDYIVWLDSDDFLLADTVALYVAELRRNPDLDVLYGNLLVADEQLRVQEVWTYHDYHGWTESLISDSTIENRLPNVGTLVRKTCYERFGLYNPEFPRAHDYEFWTRAGAGAVVKSMRTEVAIYRRHEDSLTQLRKPADTRYEANAVKALIRRHALNILFPFCYAAGAPIATGNARAWSLASLLMAKYGDTPAALTYARRSVEAADLGQNTQLLAILEALDGRVHSPSKSKAPASDEFASLVETARRQFAAGKVHPCAKACARLAEIRPEAPETLLLSAMSLRRWGAPADAQAAYHCLVHRQCGLSFLGATRDADATRVGASPTPPSDPRPVLVQRLIQRLGSVLGPESIPDAAIRSALDYLTEASNAASVPGFLDLHRHGQTPLFFAILGVLEEELDGASNPDLSRALHLVRAGLQPASTPAPTRQPGYSFCIITGGSRPEKVARQIASIRALGLEHFEILVGGNVAQVPDDVRKVDLAAAAKSGRLGKMRNTLGRLAAFDHLVVSDDDIVFDPGFAAGLKRFGEGYDLLAVRILNTDGSRFWDWATTGGLKGSVLLDYWESDPNVYVTGGICVLKTATLDRVAWDEARGFYQREDVDFSSRLKAAGFTIRYNPFSVVLHDDDRYSRVGRVVYLFDHLLGEAVQNQATRCAAETLELLQQAWRIAGSNSERQAAVQSVARRLGVSLDLAPVPASASKVTARSGVAAPSDVPAPRTGVVPESVAIDWIGSFLDHGSLSHVNRELTRALRENPDAKVQCIGEPSRLPKNAPKDWIGLASRMVSKPSRHAKVTVRHAWPPQWDRPQSGALVVIQPWEFGSLPRSWVNDLARVDEVWVPSDYVRRVYVDSGVPAEKVFVVPNGIDPARFHPKVQPLALATRKSFKFLFVGGTIFRKGPDLLLEAFLAQFTAADDVCLVIKDFGGKDVYAGQTFEQSIRAAQARPNAPEILYLNEELPPDAIPGLYTACDCLVHPYRGEGFGLPVLEAMACGLPVIVTAGGATDDFAPEQIAFRVPALRKEIGASISGMPLVRSGWLLEPDLAALSSRMRWVHDHREEARSRGIAGSQHVHAHWTWSHAAAAALHRAQAVAARTPISSPTRSAPTRPGAIELPTCARVGHLGAAHELFEKKKYREAWEFTVDALQHRPYHPEAYLLLGEIAKAVGDASSARRFGQQSKAIAPQWKPAKTFLKGHAHGNSRPSWLALPPELAETSPEHRCRLSVCLIVKNEEQFLGPCLQSIQAIAHEIIVVDTGSTDRTLEIAREFGAQVHSFVWCDDFSAARNAALEHATGDWILMLDADEQLPPEQHDNLRRDFKKSGILGLRIPLQNIGAEAEGVAYVPRLFRNAPGLFYVSRIHEQVFSSILVRAEEWGLDTALGTAQIKHYGYTNELVQSRNKSERNLRLLREAVREFPDDANLLMNLGLESVHSGNLESGIAEYEKAFQALSDHAEQQKVPELRETLLMQYASVLMKAGRYTEIVRVLESPVAKAYEPTASLHFALGLAYFRLERPALAAPQIKECLAKRHLPTASPINPDIWKAGPYHCLGLCLIHAGQLTEAEAAFRAALRDESSSRGVRLDLARLYKRMGRPIDALKVLHELIDTRQGDPEVWRLGGEIALGNPSLLDFAIDWTGEATKAHPTQALLAGQHGEALLITGNPAAAIPFFRASALAGDAYHSAALCLAELATNARPSPVPAHLEQVVSTQFLRWFQRITSSPGSSMLHQVIEQIRPLEKVLPTAAATLRTALTQAA